MYNILDIIYEKIVERNVTDCCEKKEQSNYLKVEKKFFAMLDDYQKSQFLLLEKAKVNLDEITLKNDIAVIIDICKQIYCK